MVIHTLISHPERLNRQTLFDLRKITAEHPYYQPARILLLKNLFLLHDPTFDDELRRKVDHSEESYNQVLADIKFYRHYCRTHADYENDKATSAIAHIRETYQTIKNENKFI